MDTSKYVQIFMDFQRVNLGEKTIKNYQKQTFARIDGQRETRSA